MMNNQSDIKRGLVMEGGAMRGLFTAGVIDVMMENNVTFEGGIGVSAGAAFGCNIKSGQIGRVVRYASQYCTDPRFCSIESFKKTGDLYGAKFCYEDIPCRLDPFDFEAYQKNPMKFYAVCTDVETGRPVYKELREGTGDDLVYFRASASMPIASRIVEVEGHRLLDGGISDPIPLAKFESMGFDRNVVILTQPCDYRKTKNKLMPIIRIALRKYPKVVHALLVRDIRYNRQLDYIARREAEGAVFVIRPPRSLEIGSIEHDPKEIRRVYEIGRQTMDENLEQLRNFLKR